MNPIPILDQTGVLERRIRACASWIYWIAGLTFVNMFVVLFGHDWENYFGLIGPLTIAYLGHGQPLAVEAGGGLVCALCCGLFALLGFFTSKGARWAIVLAILFYVVDTVIWMAVHLWIGVAIHAYAIWRMGIGAQAAFALAKLSPAATAAYQGVRAPATPGMWPSAPAPPMPVPPPPVPPPPVPPSPYQPDQAAVAPSPYTQPSAPPSPGAPANPAPVYQPPLYQPTPPSQSPYAPSPAAPLDPPAQSASDDLQSAPAED